MKAYIMLASDTSQDIVSKKKETERETVFSGLELGLYAIGATASDATGQAYSASIPFAITAKQRYYCDMTLEQIIEVSIQTLAEESTSENKLPIEGVSITLRSKEFLTSIGTSSDSEGMATPSIAQGTYFTTATKEGYVPQEVALTFNNKEHHKTIFMERGAVLKGYVTDEQNHPLPDVEVSVLESPISAHTDSEGQFLLEGLSVTDPGQNDLLFIHENYQTLLMNDTVISNKHLDVHLADKYRLYGTITDEQGKVIDNALIELTRINEDLAGRYRPLAEIAKTGKDGLYNFKTEIGNYKMRISAPPYPVRLESLIIERQAATKEHNIQLTRGSTLSGTLYLYDGKPLPGVKVGVLQDARYWEHPFSQFTLTESDGAWSLENLGQGDYTLYAMAPGLGKVWEDIKVPHNNLDLVIHGEIFRAQVTDAQGLPLPSAAFHYLYNHEGKDYQKEERLMNEYGDYQIVVEGGIKEVSVSSPGYHLKEFKGSLLNTDILYVKLEKE